MGNVRHVAGGSSLLRSIPVLLYDCRLGQWCFLLRLPLLHLGQALRPGLCPLLDCSILKVRSLIFKWGIRQRLRIGCRGGHGGCLGELLPSYGHLPWVHGRVGLPQSLFFRLCPVVPVVLGSL